MTPTPAARTFEVRHVQIARAAFAAIAAVMITFSPDHSAEVGLSVFSGFALATGLVLIIATWLVYPAGRRWPVLTLGIVSIVAGMVGGVGPLRTVPGFFLTVIAWAVVSGAIEAIAGWRGLRRPTARRDIVPGVADTRPVAEPGPRSESRDALTVGILTLVLGLALLLVPTQYSLDYTIDGAIEGADATFTLTGIIIGVGVFGGYAAIVAVYLAIAGFSPRKAPATPVEVTSDEGSSA